MNNYEKNALTYSLFKKRPFELPSGWAWILIAFLITNIMVYCNYDLARKAQEEPDLNLSYEKIDWAGKAVLQPNRSKIDICSKSHDSTKFIYDVKMLNRVKILNPSSILAKRVRVKLKLRDNSPFIFSVITVESRYKYGSDWLDVKIDKNIYNFILLEIESIKGDNDFCDIYFVYAYHKETIIKDNIEKNALIVEVSWEGQKKTYKKLEFDLVYK